MEGSSILQQKAGRILQKYSLLEREKLGQQLEKIEQHLDFENVSQGGRGSNLQVPGGASLVKNTKRAIDEMEPVIIELNHLKQKVECISESCTSLERALMGKERDNRDFFKSVVQVKTIISEKEKKKKILERVNNLFFLKADEEDALEGPVTVEFFIAVQKLHTAASRSSKLVRDSNSPLGLELLEYYSNRKGLVLEKCYSFIRIRFESLQDFEVSNEELTLLQKAFSFLREQPALLDSCLQEVANVLRGKTLENFVEALTKDGLSSDSIQDVQSMSFYLRFWDRGDSSFESSSHFSNNDELQRKILSVVSEGLCLPFHRRFEKAFSSRMTVIVLFKLSNLLEFYSQLFENFIGKDGAFVRTLLECSAQSMTYFFQVWKEKFDVVLENLPAVDEELSPPSFVYQCTSRLSDIMDTLDMSLLSDERKEGHAESILSFVIEHLKNFCFRLSQQLDSLNSKVFIINCLESVRVPLTKYRFAATKVESITREIDHHLDLYVEDVTKASLEQSGLLEKILRLESLSLKESTVYIASVPGMDAESIAIALKNFYMSILSGLEIEKLLNPSSSGKLSSTRMRSRVKIAISESLISAYDSLFALVNDPSNGYEEDITRRMGVVDTSYPSLIIGILLVGFKISCRHSSSFSIDRKSHRDL
ncbi:Conserved oligomeric Golgi complex subunit 6 [Galdieria sulphuraria]|nr:Conserved oligomeric Golgi complex subunit 6 [Galdieria sulphuraria]